MEIQVREQIEALQQMTVGQLREKYQEVFGEESRSYHKQFLFRRIAWHIQANAEGGLSERARQRALEIANDADLRVTSPRGFDLGAMPECRVTRKLAATDPRLPPPGQEVRRKWRGQWVVVIFEMYLEYGTLLAVLNELDRRGWRTKRWTRQDGITRGGKPFTRAALHNLLTNVLYTGRVNHKGTIYPGEHEAIIDQATWDHVQEKLERNGQTSGAKHRNKYGSLLRGLLHCGTCGTPIIHNWTARKSKRYRYYVRYAAQQRGWEHCETKSVSASMIESAVFEAIRKLGSSRKWRLKRPVRRVSKSPARSRNSDTKKRRHKGSSGAYMRSWTAWLPMTRRRAMTESWHSNRRSRQPKKAGVVGRRTPRLAVAAGG